MEPTTCDHCGVEIKINERVASINYGFAEEGDDMEEEGLINDISGDEMLICKECCKKLFLAS